MPHNNQPPPADPAIIESAPIEAGSQPATDGEPHDAMYLGIIGDLSARLESAEAENERLKGKMTVDDVRAQMMRPYANRVFWFVVSYCVVVGAMLIADGFKVYGFALSDAVLGIIAGSTAASVIGLIGIVVSGLFGGPKGGG